MINQETSHELPRPNFSLQSSMSVCLNWFISGAFNFRSLIAYSMTMTHLMPRCWRATWPPGKLQSVWRVRLHIDAPVTASQSASIVAGRPLVCAGRKDKTNLHISVSVGLRWTYLVSSGDVCLTSCNRRDYSKRSEALKIKIVFRCVYSSFSISDSDTNGDST